MSSIPTFRQYDEDRRRALVAKYGVTMSELNETYGPTYYRNDWRKLVLEMFEAGAAFTRQNWNKLTPDMQRAVLLTHRALSMPASIHEPWKITAPLEQVAA
jgi:hypothetical protein